MHMKDLEPGTASSNAVEQDLCENCDSALHLGSAGSDLSANCLWQPMAESLMGCHVNQMQHVKKWDILTSLYKLCSVCFYYGSWHTQLYTRKMYKAQFEQAVNLSVKPQPYFSAAFEISQRTSSSFLSPSSVLLHWSDWFIKWHHDMPRTWSQGVVHRRQSSWWFRKECYGKTS